MNSVEFNRAIAERVMGWKTALDESSYSDTGYTYTEAGDVILGRDFTRDHNAAAMVRERIKKVGRVGSFLRALNGLLAYPVQWSMLHATPEQTARAAYLAITGEKLESIDE